MVLNTALDCALKCMLTVNSVGTLPGTPLPADALISPRLLELTVSASQLPVPWKTALQPRLSAIRVHTAPPFFKYGQTGSICAPESPPAISGK